ncbi:exodeoxyribonuclease VII large subunit [Sulfurimonas sp.]
MKLYELKEKLSAEMRKSYSIFHGLTITDISIDKPISLDNPYYTGTQKESKKSFKATFIINKETVREFFANCTQEETNNGSAKFDIIIDKIYVSANMTLMIVAKKISETGLSQREIQRRKLHKYCLNNNIYKRNRKILNGFVLKILAITSKTSTIESDITRNIGLRDTQSIHIINCDTSQAIAQAINNYSATEEYSLIVLHRGGREDEHMGIFSSQEIIDAIVKSPIPIASALGHEQDKPFVTLVTDIDYSTPSAFAKEIKKHNETLIEIQRGLVQKITLDLKQIAKNSLNNSSSSIRSIESYANEIHGKYALTIKSSISNIELYIQSITKSQANNIQAIQNSIKNTIEKLALHARKEIDKKLEAVEKHAKNIERDKKHFIEMKALSKRKNKQIILAVSVILILIAIFAVLF